MAKFSEILTIVNGKNQSKVENPSGRYPIYGSGGVMGYADDYLCEAETVVIGRKGSINKPIYVEEPFWNVDTAFGLVAKRDLLLPKYLFYFCVHFDFEQLNTTVTIPSLTKANLMNIEMMLPSLVVQQEIINRLSKIDELIALRKEQIAKLDQLVKSRFVELFGKCNTYELLQDSKIYISDGNYSSKYPTADEFVKEGVPFIRASNMEMNTIVDNNMYFITKEKHAILLKGHVKAGDVLITTRGATIGKIACVPSRHDDSNINAQIVLLRCPNNEYNPLFLSWYLKLENTQAEIQKLISGSAQPQLPIKRLVLLSILKPDINLQNQFGAFVEQTDKSKLAIQQSLDKLELLKKALMQKYFG